MALAGYDHWYTATRGLPAALRGGVVAIGNFDGVHLGHRAVLAQASGIAVRRGVPAIALTFEPHPRTFFKPDDPVFRLTPERRKAELLFEAGMDAVVSQPFDAALAGMEADAFIRHHLIENLAAGHVITGYNFHFGRNRGGTPDLLAQRGAELGFGVTLVERFADPSHPDQHFSSSRIREALAAGDIATANHLLGRPHDVSGVVVSGARLGRTLGYPTANIRLPDETRLRHGIYAVEVRRADGSRHHAVASFGRRPTFDNGAPLLESFLFDFSDDLYGEEITVIFHGWIRPEEKFETVEALVEQMDRDSIAARAILAGAVAAS